jgi:hypothetical protein
VLGSPFEQVDDDLKRRLRRIDPGVLRHVLLEDVVLDCAPEPIDGHALTLRGSDVETEENRGGTVDRHGGGDLIERNSVE